mmetsp:Transcript_24999/g.77184  ORF Transcript_24999/g.77184 Transcript_24999/m.77184 type:complete len:108 (+) Transcript_24999:606-929(+)
MLLGDKIFSWLGIAPVPAWFQTLNDNKMMTFAAVWMANNVAAQMVATGAFEIYLDDTLVFSKLHTGRLPTAGDITGAFKPLLGGGVLKRAAVGHLDASSLPGANDEF